MVAVQRLPHPAVGQGAAASAQAVKVRMRIPEHVLVPPPEKRLIGRWVRLPSNNPIAPVVHQVIAAQAAAGIPERVLPGDLILATMAPSCAEQLAIAGARWAVTQLGEAPSDLLKGDPVLRALAAHESQVLPASTNVGYWRTEDSLDLSYDEASRTFTFSTLHISPHALVMPRHLDLPYKSWALIPVHHPLDFLPPAIDVSSQQVSSVDPVALLKEVPPPLVASIDTSDSKEADAAPTPLRRNAAILRVETTRFSVGIMIHDDGTCRLVAPTHVPELRWLTGKDILSGSDAVVVPPAELLHLLSRSGVHVLPCDVDAHLLNLDRAKEMSAAAAGFSIEPDAELSEGPKLASTKSSSVAFALPDAADDAEATSFNDTAPGLSASARFDALPVHVPLKPRVRTVEEFAYAEMARLAATFGFTSSKWNSHPDLPTEQAVLRATEAIVDPLVPGSPESRRAAEELFRFAATGESVPSFSEDPTRWHMFVATEDRELPCNCRAVTVTDTEATAEQAWSQVIEDKRQQEYAILRATTIPLDAFADATSPSAAAGAGDIGSPGGERGASPRQGASPRGVSSPRGAEAPAPEAAAAAGPVKKPVFKGEPEPGALSSITLRHALQPRASSEAMAIVDTTPPLFVDTVEKLLRLVRPLSFTQ